MWGVSLAAAAAARAAPAHGLVTVLVVHNKVGVHKVLVHKVLVHIHTVGQVMVLALGHTAACMHTHTAQAMVWEWVVVSTQACSIPQKAHTLRCSIPTTAHTARTARMLCHFTAAMGAHTARTACKAHTAHTQGLQGLQGSMAAAMHTAVHNCWVRGSGLTVTVARTY